MDVAWTIILTLAGIFALGIVAGFTVLFRRGRREGPALHASRSGAPIAVANPKAAAARRANILLVQADDAVRDASDELDFALAQFGEERTRALAAVVASSKRRVMEAFELQQRLDDAIPDSEAQRRDWTARIVHLCESAQEELAAELQALDRLREAERNAPETLAALRRRVEALQTQRTEAGVVWAELQRSYAPTAVASVSDSLDRADEELDQAREAIDTAALAADPDGQASSSRATSDAIDALRSGEDHARRAGHLLDAVRALREQLAAADAALAESIRHSRENLDEARALRDGTTDAPAGAEVIAAITAAEGALGKVDERDPPASLDRLRDANARLDAAMSGARNAEQRLAQAREALAGALVGARSQVATTRDYIEGRRGGIGSEARTRLAEAERLLAVAEAEVDPVLALDTVRSAATYARDADALARYDLLR
ncbi:MAG: hypothetical protein IR160_04550 [Salinibacterium sp.]|nr:hypothetical protein [Salinibacterium sp.]MBF0671838.1 hypothetical protein [Salinibacterium sp.]